MSQILVMVKSESGLLIPCRPVKQEDGCVWECGCCGAICCRVSFGVMNGFWRCRCGLETEVTVDGKIIDLRQYNTEPLEQRASEPQLSSDDEFLKTCGIAVETNEP